MLRPRRELLHSDGFRPTKKACNGLPQQNLPEADQDRIGTWLATARSSAPRAEFNDANASYNENRSLV